MLTNPLPGGTISVLRLAKLVEYAPPAPPWLTCTTLVVPPAVSQVIRMFLFVRATLVIVNGTGVGLTTSKATRALIRLLPVGVPQPVQRS